MRILFAFLVVLISVSTFASQASSILQNAQCEAAQDIAQVKSQLAAEAKKIKDYDSCKVTELTLRRDYDQWFLNHYANFQQLDQDFDQVIAAANTRLARLQSLSVHAVPVQGQSDGPEVSFKDMIQYFTLFNSRLKANAKTGMSDLMRQQEDPSLNPMKIAHSQVTAAMQSMTVMLNSSLKAQTTSYEIVFKQQQDVYSLELKVDLTLNGVTKILSFSLLGKESGFASSPIVMDEKQKWKLLSQLSIDGQSVDGFSRYSATRAKLQTECTQIPQIIAGTSSAPFVKYTDLHDLEEHDAEVKEEELNSPHFSGSQIYSENEDDYVHKLIFEDGVLITVKTQERKGMVYIDPLSNVVSRKELPSEKPLDDEESVPCSLQKETRRYKIYYCTSRFSQYSSWGYLYIPKDRQKRVYHKYNNGHMSALELVR